MAASRVIVECRQDRPRLAAILAVMAALPLLLLLGYLARHFHLSPLILLGALPPLFAPVIWRTRTVMLEASREGLRVGGKLTIPRAKLGEAWLTEDAKGRPRFHVQTVGKIGAATFRPPRVEDGERLAAALPPAGDAITTNVVNKRAQITAFVALALSQIAPRLLTRHLESLVGFWPTMGLGMGFIALVATALHLTRKKVVTGSDGFEIVSLRKRRFVPYAEVTGVDDKGAVHLRTGEVIPIGKPMASSSGEDSAAPYVRALARIEQKSIAAREARVRDEAATLAVTAATAAGASDTGTAYRVASPTEDALWTAVAAGQARTSVRARAARSLLEARGPDGAESVRARIATIASETASTDARAALGALAEADDGDREDLESAKKKRAPR